MENYLDLILKIILGILALFGAKGVANKLLLKINNKSNNLKLDNSSTEHVGRDKFVNITNNYSTQTVGRKEELLGTLEVKEPHKQISETDFRIIAMERVQNIKDSPITSPIDVGKIQRFFQKAFDESHSQRNAASLLSGAFFAISSEATNPEWREHCASSLRELFHGWSGGRAGSISEAFNLAKGKALDFPSMRYKSDFYNRMATYYDYFSEKCHHGHGESVRKLRLIHADDGIKLEEDDIFIKTVAKFLFELFEVIKTTEI